MEPLLPFKYLLFLIVAGAFFLIRVICFCVTAIRSKRRMESYDRFVNGQYTCNGKQTPVFLLRIQNEYIEAYNKMARQWLGRLFRLRSYPEKSGQSKEPMIDNRINNVDRKFANHRI